MTTIRSLTLVAAAAAAVAATGCGKKCGDATPPVGNISASASCTAQAGAPVTVTFHVCPKCDQAQPTCLVHAESAAQGQITLEPVSEVCDPSTCPIVDPASCTIPTLNCQFTAPGANANVSIVTPSGVQNFPLTVTAASGTPPPTTCAL